MRIIKFLELLFANRIDYLYNSSSLTDLLEDKNFLKTHYQQHVLPHVQEFEAKRISALQILRKRTIIVVPISIIIIAAAIYLIKSYSTDIDMIEIIILTAIVIISILIYWSFNPVKNYKSSVKSKIFPSIFKFFGENYYYSENSHFKVSSLKPSLIIPYFEKEHTEDYVHGSYEDVGIDILETKLTKTQNMIKFERTITVFEGILILLDMNKSFSGKTVVQKDSGIIGNWLREQLTALENVQLEDTIFEDQFEVYSSDQVEARYLLTTSFMERLIKVSELFKSPKIQCSFYSNKILLMIPSSINRFETASIFYPSTFVHEINAIISEMDLIFQTIDTLKLNQRTGL